jgi:hypothetical protein
MNRLFDIALLLFCLGLLILNIKNNQTYLELECNMIAEVKIKDRRIEELEKEIRLLKTDINIIQYGYGEKMLDK